MATQVDDVTVNLECASVTLPNAVLVKVDGQNTYQIVPKDEGEIPPIVDGTGDPVLIGHSHTIDQIVNLKSDVETIVQNYLANEGGGSTGSGEDGDGTSSDGHKHLVEDITDFNTVLQDQLASYKTNTIDTAIATAVSGLVDETTFENHNHEASTLTNFSSAVTTVINAADLNNNQSFTTALAGKVSTSTFNGHKHATTDIDQFDQKVKEIVNGMGLTGGGSGEGGGASPGDHDHTAEQITDFTNAVATVVNGAAETGEGALDLTGNPSLSKALADKVSTSDLKTQVSTIVNGNEEGEGALDLTQNQSLVTALGGKLDTSTFNGHTHTVESIEQFDQKVKDIVNGMGLTSGGEDNVNTTHVHNSSAIADAIKNYEENETITWYNATTGQSASDFSFRIDPTKLNATVKVIRISLSVLTQRSSMLR